MLPESDIFSSFYFIFYKFAYFSFLFNHWFFFKLTLSVIDKAVCRIAPTTPGMLYTFVIHLFKFFFQRTVFLLYSRYNIYAQLGLEGVNFKNALILFSALSEYPNPCRQLPILRWLISGCCSLWSIPFLWSLSTLWRNASTRRKTQVHIAFFLFLVWFLEWETFFGKR